MIGWLVVAGALVVGYLLGAIPTGLLIGKWFAGIDIREHGSKNIGFTNAMRVLGWRLGVPVLLIDVGKAVAAVLVLPMVARLVAGGAVPLEPLAVYVGAAVLLGNLVNVFLGGKGGKGVATALGVFLALAWLPTLVALGVFLVVLAATRYVSLGSILAAVVLPVGVLLTQGHHALFWMTLLISTAVIVKHRANIARLMAGTENKVGRRQAAPATDKP